MDFRDIPQFPRAHYQINVGWGYLEQQIKSEPELDLEPDFQRAHVWTEAQQRDYIEYSLQGGEVGRNLTFNCIGWMQKFDGPYVIVDGKQRLEAVRKFMRSELRAFGLYFKEFRGTLRMTQCDFLWRVCNLETRAEVLKLYLNINAGGTPHTAKEIARVRALLAKETT